MSLKTRSLIEIFFYYTIVSIICIIFAYFIKANFNIYITVLLSDILGTVLIFGIGLLKKTASLYDPYWSVAPIIIALTLMIYFNNFSLMLIIIFISLLFWSIRLTVNFTVDFTSFSYIDYRYKILKKKFGKYYELINLLGICLFPTLIVFFAMIPFISLVSMASSFNPLFIIGIIILNLGTILELFSDKQSRTFRSNRKSRITLNRNGLWKYSRHPNYLGEILVWWGLYLSVILIGNFNPFIGIGALLNTCLFIFISIPIAESHLSSYKENYKEYKSETRMLLPIKRFRK